MPYAETTEMTKKAPQRPQGAHGLHPAPKRMQSLTPKLPLPRYSSHGTSGPQGPSPSARVSKGQEQALPPLSSFPGPPNSQKPFRPLPSYTSPTCLVYYPSLYYIVKKSQELTVSLFLELDYKCFKGRDPARRRSDHSRCPTRQREEPDTSGFKPQLCHHWLCDLGQVTGSL